MSNRGLQIRRKHTNRGFGLLLFEDDYGEECSLQESSSVEPHVWLGMDNPRMLDGVLIARMHLNRKQARQLADELLYFAENERLRGKEQKNV